MDRFPLHDPPLPGFAGRTDECGIPVHPRPPRPVPPVDPPPDRSHDPQPARRETPEGEPTPESELLEPMP